MSPKHIIHHLVVILFSLIFTGCHLIKPADPIPGIDHPIHSGNVQLKLIEARIKSTYATHYIMHYPPEGYLFYSLTAEIEGLENPQSSLSWGKENLGIFGPNGSQAFVYATWNLSGDDIQYKSNADFKYHYVFIYQIPSTSDFNSFAIHLKDGQVILSSSILIATSSLDVSGEKSKESDSAIITPTEPSGENAVLAGGSHNTSSAYHTTVGGGYSNTTSAAYGSVLGGRENQAVNLYTTIGGGYANIASGRDATVGGGSRNTASQYHAVISGGIRNQATASDTTISGGSYNQATGLYATIGGGTQNQASGFGSVVAGGSGNTASHDQGTVSGGLGNVVEGNYSVISGGYGNTIQGAYATIPGGDQNQVMADFSLAAGHRAVVQPEHHGTFLLADSQNHDFYSAAPNELGVRATGGVRFVTSVDDSGIPISGVSLSPGSGSWATLSDQNLKENFTPIDSQEILRLVASLPLSEWNYTSQDPSVRHIGPFAQDFHIAFGTGDSHRTINTVDADGVSFAAIQGLYQILIEKESQIQDLEQRLDRIETLSRHNNILCLLIGSLIIILMMSAWKRSQASKFKTLGNHQRN